MSDSETERKGSSTRIKRFNGAPTDSYSHYRLRLVSCMRQKGLWYLFAEESGSSSSTTSTRDADKWTATDIIIQSLGDKPLSILAELDGQPREMLAALDARYRGATTTDVIILLGEVHNKQYRDSMDMSLFVDELGDLFSRLRAIKSPMTDLMQVGFLLAKIPQSSAMHAAAAALRSMNPSELTWEMATNRLVAEYKTMDSKPGDLRRRNRGKKKGKATRKGAPLSDVDDELDVASIAQAVALAMKAEAKRPTTVCNFCGKKGHHEDKCFQNPDNPGNTLPQKLRDKLLVADSSSSKSDPAPRKAKRSTASVEVLAMAHVDALTTVAPPVSEHSTKEPRCVVDSGATVSLFHSRSAFVPGTLAPAAPRSIVLADQRTIVANMAGDVVIPFKGVNLRITECLLAPDLGYNLVSVGRLADKGIRSTFDVNRMSLSMDSGTFVGTGVRESKSGLYYLPAPVEQSSALSVCDRARADNVSLTNLWHRRLAHVGYGDLASASKWTDGIPPDLVDCGMPVCDPCRMGKAHRLPFTGKFERATRVGQIVHSDIAGPLPSSYRWGYRYMATFTDDCSRHTTVAFMQRKSQLRSAFEKFKLQLTALVKQSVAIDELRTCDVEEYNAVVGKDSGVRIIRLHSDQGKEYKALEQDDTHLATYSPTYTPQHNAIAERVNRTIFDAARTLLIDSKIPQCFWPYAVSHVVCVRNRLRHSTVDDAPHTIVTGCRPSVKNVRVFGCRAFVLVQPGEAKMNPRAEPGVLLGCSDHGAYTVLVDGGDRAPRLVTSRHVTFDESSFPGLEEYAHAMSDEDTASASDGENYLLQDDGQSSDETSATGDSSCLDSGSDSDWYSSGDSSEEHQPPTQSDQIEAECEDDSHSEDDQFVPDELAGEDAHDSAGSNTAKYQRYPGLSRVRKQTSHLWRGALAAHETEITTSDSPTLREALGATPTERDLWLQSIDDEFKSLDDKGTWTRVESTGDMPSALPTHTVHSVKRRAGGVFERCKTRVVAGGNHQTFGVDYFETHAPVVDFATVRFFLCLSVIFSWTRVQVDVKTAFLNGELEEEIYVRSPRGIPGKPSLLYRLLKALYGLKQAHLAWHSRVTKDFKSAGFIELPSCPCVFVKWYDDHGLVIILVYVDDFLILSPNKERANETVELLSSWYELRVMDDVTLYLGVELHWKKTDDGEALVLSHQSYIMNVLKRFGMDKCRPCATPMVEGFFAGLDQEQDVAVVEQNLYQQCIGCLLHIALRTRPDIMTATGILSRFCASPTMYCHKALKRVLRYLKGSINVGLEYGAVRECVKPAICVFVDSDYASDSMTRKSTSGMAMLLESGLVHWHSRKQKATALSTCEAEYRAMTEASMDALLYERVLKEVGLGSGRPAQMMSDNEAALGWASGERAPYKRAKHIDVAVHFIRDKVRDGRIEVKYVPTDENVSDGLTKPLGRIAFGRMKKKFGMVVADEVCAGEC